MMLTYAQSFNQMEVEVNKLNQLWEAGQQMSNQKTSIDEDPLAGIKTPLIDLQVQQFQQGVCSLQQPVATFVHLPRPALEIDNAIITPNSYVTTGHEVDL